MYVENDDGEYKVLLTVLNNTKGNEAFVTPEHVEKLFGEKSKIKKRIEEGTVLLGLGHPVKKPCESMEDFYNRINTVNLSESSGFLKSIWIDYEYGKKHPELEQPDLIGIMGTFKPAGTNKDLVVETLRSTKERLFFHRGFKKVDFREDGRRVDTLVRISTFDLILPKKQV